MWVKNDVASHNITINREKIAYFRLDFYTPILVCYIVHSNCFDSYIYPIGNEMDAAMISNKHALQCGRHKHVSTIREWRNTHKNEANGISSTIHIFGEWFVYCLAVNTLFCRLKIKCNFSNTCKWNCIHCTWWLR